MTKLGVNIDHTATLRQARYRDVPLGSKIIVEPSPIETALIAEIAGADSITAHLREDRRHMQDEDIRQLRKNIKTKLNLEMACSEEITKFALDIMPEYACLVPENRQEVTTEGGIDLIKNRANTERTFEALANQNIICSIFIDPNPEQISIASQMGVPVIELHTGAYANAWGDDDAVEFQLNRLIEATKFAKEHSIIVNSGHGINYQNVTKLKNAIDFNEMNIGHSIMARALIVGVQKATEEMIALIKGDA